MLVKARKLDLPIDIQCNLFESIVFFYKKILFVNTNQQKTYSLYTKVREKDIRPWRVKRRGQRKEDGNNV